MHVLLGLECFDKNECKIACKIKHEKEKPGGKRVCNIIRQKSIMCMYAKCFTAEPGRRSRSHIPERSQDIGSKQIKFTDIISPETLSFISQLQKLNVTKLAGSGGGVISVGGATSGSEEINAYNPSVGTPLLSGDFLNVESTKPLIIPKESTRQPTKEEIEAYHKLKHKCWFL